MDDLTAFIAARLAEDEAMANAGARRVGTPWLAEPQPGTPGGLVTDELGLVGSTGGLYAAEHIARHDPARVLRDVAAKRAILFRHEDCRIRTQDATYPNAIAHEQVREYEDFVLPNLAVAWSDHSDYRQEWKP